MSLKERENTFILTLDFNFLLPVDGFVISCFRMSCSFSLNSHGKLRSLKIFLYLFLQINLYMYFSCCFIKASVNNTVKIENYKCVGLHDDIACVEVSGADVFYSLI